MDQWVFDDLCIYVANNPVRWVQTECRRLCDAVNLEVNKLLKMTVRCLKERHIYFGLLVFVGYVVVDAQEIMEKAHFEDLDYIKNAVSLFTDFGQ
ncbi:Bax inhibitor 1-related protein [Artemisia annua]|uniref:Bax inhibitor 1-related protein n=1 Tax=Artemisia annua TaxID=35608 RepID=A0A2U1LYY3_ARTAN|nr:Bax inhibitor 1-related protein [Artemisia annua]